MFTVIYSYLQYSYSALCTTIFLSLSLSENQFSFIGKLTNFPTFCVTFFFPTFLCVIHGLHITSKHALIRCILCNSWTAYNVQTRSHPLYPV